MKQGQQEPGSEEEIRRFAVEEYGAQFELFGKVNVNGNDAHPVFSFLKSRLGGLLGSSLKWNFTKFLVDRNGQFIKSETVVRSSVDWFSLPQSAQTLSKTRCIATQASR